MMLNEYTGCLHIHLNPDIRDDNFNIIVSGAINSGLDFLILNPHTPCRKRSLDYFLMEGYRDGVLILAGEEADEKTGLNHILVYGKKNWVGRRPLEEIVKFIENNSLISFAAHPDGKHRLFGFQNDHRWTKRHLLNFLTGIEVWSLLFDFSARTNPSNVLIRYLAFPGNLKGPSFSTLSLWDRIAKIRRFTGVSGLDIHPLRYGLKYFDIKKNFEYGSVFKILRNHILTEKRLTGNSSTDIKIIEDAFRNARVFFANDFIADSTGFFFGTEDRKSTMGDCVNSDKELLVELPEQADARIITAKKVISFKSVRRMVFKPEESGPCRIEVYYRGMPWIFSNHIYVMKLTDAEI